jgi:hypothetical protein
MRSLPGWALHWLGAKTGLTRRRARPGAVVEPPVHHTPPPICGDVRGWCETHTHAGATYRVIVDAQHIVRPPPQTIEPAVDQVFDRYYEVDAPEEALVGISGASVATNGLIFLPDGSLVGQAVTHLLEFRPLILANEPAYIRPLPTTVRNLSGNYYSLMFGNHDNYYHWHHDVVMRLPAVLPHLPADTRFIVPPSIEKVHFAKAMLEVVGLQPEQLCVYPRDEVWTCERLYFYVPYLKPILDTARHMHVFSDLCLSEYGIKQRDPAKRIFISRRFDNHWRLSNEAEVMALLERYGFEAHQLAQLTFEQQVALFAQAEMIVGTGAGLSNMIFAPPGVKILNMQDASRPGAVYYTMSSALGHPYWYLLGDPVPNPESRYGRADLFVPLDKLRDTLEEMLG